MSDQDASKDPSQKARERASQVSEHLSSSSQSNDISQANTSRRRRRKAKKEDELPADYSDILGHLSKLRELADTPNPLAEATFAKSKTANCGFEKESMLSSTKTLLKKSATQPATSNGNL